MRPRPDLPSPRVLLSAIAFCALAAQICLGQQSLKWNWQTDDRYRIVTSQDVVMVAEVGEKSVRMGHRTVVQVAWRVTSVDSNGAAEIEQSIERIRLLLRSTGGEDVVFDSEADEAPQGPAKQLAAAARPLLKATMALKVGPTCRVSDVRLSDDAKLPPPASAPAAEAFSRFLTQEGAVELTGLSHLALPEQPVSVGDRWDRTTQVRTGAVAFARKTAYERLADQTRDEETLAQISLSWTLSPAQDPKPPLPGEEARKPAVRIEQQDNRGKILFALTQGHPVEADLQQRMTIVSRSADQKITQQVASIVKMRITKMAR